MSLSIEVQGFTDSCFRQTAVTYLISLD
jgi:hypothetical protein